MPPLAFEVHAHTPRKDHNNGARGFYWSSQSDLRSMDQCGSERWMGGGGYG